MEHERSEIERVRSLRGFTLIEILIVLVIISIVTTVALTSMKVNENRRVQNFSNELSQLISLVEEQALLRPEVLGVKINKGEFEFVSYKSDADVSKEQSQWVLIEDDDLLGKHEIPDDIRINVVSGDDKDTVEEETFLPQIIFSTNGDVTPFAIYVGIQGKDPRYLVRGEANGTITVKELS